MLKKITISFSIILLFISCFFIFFKGEGPLEINISYINFYIKKKILKIFTNSDVSMESTSVIWHQDGKLVITDLKITNPDFTIEVPELFVHFKLSSKKFSQVLADNVHIYIKREESKEITSVMTEKMSSTKNLLKTIRKFFFYFNADSRIKITNIAINKSMEGEFFIDKVYVGKGEDFNVLDIRVHTKEGKGFLDDLSITIKNRNNLLNFYGTFYNLKLGLFNEFSTLVKSYNLDKEIGFKGNFSIRINGKDEVVDGNIYVLNTESHSGKNLALTNVNLTYSDEIISIKNFHFKLNDTYLSLIGKMNFGTNHALLRVNISKLVAKDLCTYVPDGLVNNEFRKWYCNNIDGNIINTIISFNGKIDSLINDDLSGIVIVADIENGSVQFDEDFERVENLNGELTLKDNNLKIIVNSAKFQNFNIDGGEIEMQSLNKEDSVLTINGQAVSDAYGLYEPIKFKLDDMMKITRDSIGGIAKSVFSFHIFNLNADDKKVDFLAKFHSEIDNFVAYNGSLGKYEIKLDFGGDFIDLNGSGMVNNTQLLFDLKSSNKNENFAWSLTGDLPAQILNFGDGYINANIESVMYQDKTGYVNGNIDLSELELRSSYLGGKTILKITMKFYFLQG